MTERTLSNGFGFFAKKDKTAANQDEITISRTFKNTFDLGENGNTADIKTWIADIKTKLEDGETQLDKAREKHANPEIYLQNTRKAIDNLNDLIDNLNASFTPLCNGAMSALRNHNRPEALRTLESHLVVEQILDSDFKTITEDELNLLYKDLSKEDRQNRLNEYLVKGRDPDLAITLVKAGANPNIDNHNILRRAVRGGHTDLVKCLHEHGADFDAAILQETIHGKDFTVEQLQAYQKKFTGQISDYSPKLEKQTILELQQNVQDLTKQCEKLERQVARKPAPRSYWPK